MNAPLRVAVVIGRFQPYTNVHKMVVDDLLAHFDHVIVLIASSVTHRTRNEPWLWVERADMILAAHPNDEHRIYTVPVNDTEKDDEWAIAVKGIVSSCAPPNSVFTMVGNNSRLFPELQHYSVIRPDWAIRAIPSAEIRKRYFESAGSFESKVEDYVPPSTLARMQQLIDMRALEGLKA